MDRIQPKDFIALLIISGLIAFKLSGHNGSFDPAVALIIGYYFVKRQAGMDSGK